MCPCLEWALDIVGANADRRRGRAAEAEQATSGELEACTQLVLMVAVRRAEAAREAARGVAAAELDAVALALDPPGHIASHKTVPATFALETVVAVLRLPLSRTLHD